MNPTPSCPSLWGKIFGHNFEARYHIDEKESSRSFDTWGVFSRDMPLILAAMKLQNKKYLGEICTRCGHIVEVET